MSTIWIPTAITIVLGGLTAVSPNIQEFIRNHPEWTTVVITAYTLLKGLLPSPLKGMRK